MTISNKSKLIAEAADASIRFEPQLNIAVEKPEEPSPQLFEHGYPAVCWECWKDLTNKEKKEYQKASVPTL